MSRLPRLWPLLARLLTLFALVACGPTDGPTALEVTLVVPSTTIEVGGNVQLSVLRASGPVTWSSSNTAVATVVSTGFVTAVGPGTATITVSTPTQSASTTITVNAPPAIALASTSVSFSARVGGGAPTARSVAVSNSAVGTLQGLTVGEIVYAAGEPTGWLTAALNATTATIAQPAQLLLSASQSGLAAGSYSARVSVSAAQAANGPQELQVTFVVGPAPTLVLPTAPVAFTRQAGTAAATERTLAVSAGLAGDTLSGLSVSVSGPATWLTASLDRTSTPAVLRLSAVAGALTPGLYSAQVLVTAPAAANSPQSVTVTLEVTQPPVLQLSSTNASFVSVVGGANPAPAAIAVTNSGGGTLALGGVTVEYPAGSPTGWLNAVLSSPNAPSTLTLQPITGALAAGTYTATARVAAPGAVGAPATVAVTFVVGSSARIALSATSATFVAGVGGSDPAPDAITVSNSGAGALEDLDVDVTYGAGAATWLEATLNTTSAPATLTLQPRTAGLSAGTYTATVNVSAPLADNAPRSISVTFTLAATPILVLSRSDVAITAPVGGLSETQTVSVSNGGGGALTGLGVSVEYASGSSWLAASLSGSSAPATLSLQANALSLAAGTYTATVRVTSPAATNSPRTITVSLTVVAQPAIGLSVTSRTFTAAAGAPNPAAQTVAITNTGTGSLTGLATSIAYGSGTNWLTATLTSTTGPATLTLQPITAGLAVGTYTATVSVTSPVAINSPRTVTVTFTVTNPPAIGLSVTSRTFSVTVGGANPVAQTVTISNTGGGTLTGLARTITYSSGSGWLTATLNATTAPATLTLQPLTGALAAGTYTASVAITSPVASNSPRTITVTFTVNAPPPVIALSVTSRTFTAPSGGGNPLAQTATITNSGGGTLSGLTATTSYGSGSGWLATSLSATSITTGSSTLTLTPSTGSLAAGTYTATVTIASTVSGVVSRQVTVTFTVPAASIGLSAVSASLTRTAGSGSGSTTISITNAGAGTLLLSPSPPTISYSGTGGWLSASYSTTSVTTGSSTLTLTMNASAVNPGTYSATVTVGSSVATSRTIAVTFTVNVSLALNIMPAVQSSSCNGCHTWSTPTAFRNYVVNVATTVRTPTFPLASTIPTRVVPFNANASYLIYQLDGSPGAYRMPTSTLTPLLSTTVRNYIRDWINQGANNN